MNKPVAVIGTPGAISNSFALSTRDAFALTGHNTGNLAFQYASWNLIEDQKQVFKFDFDPATVRDTCRLIVLPAANFLYNGFDLGDLARRLEETKLPLVVLGLGAQAMRSVDEIKLQPGTERLLRVMAERCETIGLRGKYTAQVLQRYGVQNFEILGCPSNFINSDREMGRQIASRVEARDGAVAFCPTFYSYNSEFEEVMYRSLQSRVTQIVCQDPITAVALARGDADLDQLNWLNSASGFLLRLSGPERDALRPMLRAYFSIEAWMEAYRATDLVIGSRIHGVNVGWQTGRGALVVSFDLRTEELADTMGVPWVKAGDMAMGDRTVPFVKERVTAAAQVYDQRRNLLANAFIALLQRSDLTPSQSLRQLAALEEAKPTANGLEAAADKVEWGFLEQYSRKHIAGWVDSNEPVNFEVVARLDGVEIGATVPNVPRSDLGKNARGFDIVPPVDTEFRDVMRLEVVFRKTGSHLKNSPIVTSFRLGDEAKVLQGKAGHLFLQNDSNHVLKQVSGQRPLNEQELGRWREFFSRLEDGAQRSMMRVVFLVAPSKECILAEFLPDSISVSENRAVRQLEAMAKDLRLEQTHVLYPMEALRRATTYDIYPKGDSHWTDYGAAVALDTVWSYLWPHRNNPMPSQRRRFNLEYRNADLRAKLGGVCIEAQPVEVRETKSIHLVENNDINNTGRRQLHRSLWPGTEGEVRLLHDSYGDWMIPLLAESAANIRSYWSSVLPVTWLEGGPSCSLLIERAERFLLVPSAVEK